MPKNLPSTGARRTGCAGGLTPSKWTRCCTANACADVTKRLHRRNIDGLPDGAFVAFGEDAFAIRGDRILRWTPQGYDAQKPRPRGGTVDVLTPPAILAVLSAGYEPRWHPSAAMGG